MEKGLRIRNIIERMPLFTGLSDEDLAGVESIITVKEFSKNEVILQEEDTPNYIYMVFSGKVKVMQTSADGKEHILAVRGKGGSFGEMAVIDGKTSPATVVAMEDAEIGLIKKDDFEKYLLSNTRFLRQAILLLSSRLRDAWLRLKVLTLADAEERVRAVLELISIQHGIQDYHGTIIALKLTHEEIARYASLSRETVTRQLNKLSKLDRIEILQDKRIRLKPAFFEKRLFL
jgi:CRP/FNR family transcriptional regulator